MHDIGLYKSLKYIITLATIFLSHYDYWQLPRTYLDITAIFIKKKLLFLFKSEVSQDYLLFCPQWNETKWAPLWFLLPSPSYTLICPTQKSIPSRRIKIISKSDIVTHYHVLSRDWQKTSKILLNGLNITKITIQWSENNISTIDYFIAVN